MVDVLLYLQYPLTNILSSTTTYLLYHIDPNARQPLSKMTPQIKHVCQGKMC